MADYGRISKAIVKAIADALRYCNGNEAQYTPGQMPNAVRLLKKRLTQKTITRNGVYIPSSGYDGFDRVTVNVQGGDTVLVEKSITANGEYSPSDDNADGYSSVSVAVPGPNLQSKTATQNGTVTPDTGYDGLSAVDVAVPNTYSAADDGKVVSGGALVAQTERTVDANGTYDTTENNSVVVAVPNTFGESDEGKVVKNGALISQNNKTVYGTGTYDTTTINLIRVSMFLQSKNITENGTYTYDPDKGFHGLGYVNVNVPNTYAAEDEGKVVSNGALVEQTEQTITQNGTVDTTENNSVIVAVQNSYSASDEGKVVKNGALASQSTREYSANGWYDTTTVSRIHIDVPATTPNLQVKTVTANGTVEADPGYDGLLRVIVNVSGGGGVANAIETESGDALETENGDIIEFDGGTT